MNHTGLLDELALFKRPLAGAEVEALHKKPGKPRASVKQCPLWDGWRR